MIHYLLIPLMTGLFGWMVVWLFVKSLFFPPQPLSWGGFRWQNPAQVFLREFPLDSLLINSNDTPLQSFLPLVNDKLDDFFNYKLKEKLPIISMFVGEKTTIELKAVFVEELQLIFPELIKHFTSSTKNNLANSLNLKMISHWESLLLKASLPLRWIAFIVGFIWGALTLFIYQLL